MEKSVQRSEEEVLSKWSDEFNSLIKRIQKKCPSLKENGDCVNGLPCYTKNGNRPRYCLQQKNE